MELCIGGRGGPCRGGSWGRNGRGPHVPFQPGAAQIAQAAQAAHHAQAGPKGPLPPPTPSPLPTPAVGGGRGAGAFPASPGPGAWARGGRGGRGRGGRGGGEVGGSVPEPGAVPPPDVPAKDSCPPPPAGNAGKGKGKGKKGRVEKKVMTPEEEDAMLEAAKREFERILERVLPGLVDADVRHGVVQLKGSGRGMWMDTPSSKPPTDPPPDPGCRELSSDGVLDTILRCILDPLVPLGPPGPPGSGMEEGGGGRLVVMDGDPLRPGSFTSIANHLARQTAKSKSPVKLVLFAMTGQHHQACRSSWKYCPNCHVIEVPNFKNFTLLGSTITKIARAPRVVIAGGGPTVLNEFLSKEEGGEQNTTWEVFPLWAYDDRAETWRVPTLVNLSRELRQRDAAPSVPPEALPRYKRLVVRSVGRSGRV